MSQSQEFHYLRAPLCGGTVIEASAGTGKTWTLERLVVRLLVEKEMRRAPTVMGRIDPGISRILIVTFTKAATNELRRRIRAALVRLVELIGTKDEPSEGAFADADWGELLTHWNSMGLLFPDIRTQLALCIDRFDDAAIYTIHSFCQKMLQSYSFSGAEPLDEEQGDDRGLIADLVEEFVRRECVRDPSMALPLMDQCSLLQELLHVLSSRPRCAPEPVIEMQQPEPGKGKKVQEISPEQQAQEAACYAKLADIVRRFCKECPRLLQQRKQRLGIITYNDMLVRMQELCERVNGKDTAFAQKVRSLFDAVLIDEFQDTDSLQFSIFRELFLGPEAADKAVFVVGDPKQSIYAFRGAQLAAYFAASREIGEDRRQTLNKNYRSAPELVQAVNCLFARDRAFANDQIESREVKAGKTSGRLVFQGAHGSQLLPAFTLLNARVMGTSEDAVQYEDGWIALQIRSLLQSPVFVQDRRLRASDIVILVRKRSEADSLIKKLRSVGVRAVLEGSGDVMKSEEAEEILAVLSAMSDPRQSGKVVAARATRIFGETLASVMDERKVARARLVLQASCALLEREGLSSAFSHLFSVCQVTARLLPIVGGERSLANYAQVLELLAARAGSTPSASSLAQTLAQMMEQDSSSNSEERQLRPESDEDLVRIQTIHQSKGLEYPVVFVHKAAALARDTKLRSQVLLEDSPSGLPQAHVYFSVPKQQQAPFAFRQDEAESIRLLYVAATRASARLYLPLVLNVSAKRTKAGVPYKPRWSCHSALGILLKNGAVPQDPAELDALYQGLVEQIRSSGNPAFEVIVDPNGELYSEQQEQNIGSQNALNLRTDPARAHPRTWAHTSFTGLTRGLDQTPMPGDDEEVEGSSNESALADQQSLLFAGESLRDVTVTPATALGVLLHKVMEDSVREPDRMAFLSPQTAKTWVEGVLEQFSNVSFSGVRDPAAVIAENLRDVWTSELVPGIVLRDLPPENMFAEMRFFLPLAPGADAREISRIIRRHVPQWDPGQLSGRDLAGFLEGSLDLAFLAGGKFWVYDWKSNRAPSWDPVSLQEKVLESRYQLQLLLYLVALKRMIALRLGEKHSWEKVGGAADIFLRGLDAGESLIEGRRSGVVPMPVHLELLKELDGLFAGGVSYA